MYVVLCYIIFGSIGGIFSLIMDSDSKRAKLIKKILGVILAGIFVAAIVHSLFY